MQQTSRRQFNRQGLAYACLSLTGAFGGQLSEGESSQLAKLRSSFKGELLTPDSPQYETARFSWNRRFDRHPALIARCSNADDALRAFEYAQQNALPVAVRGGGHSMAAFSTCDRDVVIDFGQMDAVQIDEKNRLIIAEAGARIGKLQSLAATKGMVANLPSSLTIGAAGAAMAAGIGELTVPYGTSADTLTAARCILPDGTRVTADEGHTTDLLWSLRGAGANFAIVTEVTLQLFEAPLVYDFEIFCPPAAAGELFRRFDDTASEYKERFSSAFSAFGAPAKPSQIVASGLFFGTENDGKALVAKLSRGLDKLKVDAASKKYAVDQYKEPDRKHFAFTRWATNTGPLSDDLISTLLRTDETPPFGRFVTLNPRYGVDTLRRLEKAAYSDRAPGVDVGIWADAPDPNAATAAGQWTQDLWDRLHGERCGGYPSLLQAEGLTRIESTYGKNYPRLRALKAKYDPKNILNSNVNIHPA